MTDPVVSSVLRWCNIAMSKKTQCGELAGNFIRELHYHLQMTHTLSSQYERAPKRGSLFVLLLKVSESFTV